MLDEICNNTAKSNTVFIKQKVATLKEPLLRKILRGEKINDKEDGYLTALEDVERMLEKHLTD